MQELAKLTSGYPTDWSTYISLMKSGGVSNGENLSVFGARYRLARQFEQLHFANIGNNTATFYSAVAKLGFAYSSLDYLELITLVKVSDRLPIHAGDLANQLRKPGFQPLLLMSIEHASSEKLQNRLKTLADSSEEVDVRPFIESMRHSLFHGRFTPGSSGLTSTKKLLNLFEGLSQVTLRVADEMFTTAVLEKQEKRKFN